MTETEEFDYVEDDLPRRPFMRSGSQKFVSHEEIARRLANHILVIEQGIKMFPEDKMESLTQMSAMFTAAQLLGVPYEMVRKAMEAK